MKHIYLLVLLSALFAPKATAAGDEARLLRFPSVGGNNIVFTYAGDLYRVDINGGEAVRLTSDVGYEMFSRISPDGKTIAFTAQYDGNTEVYSMPVTGGEPKRLSWTALVDRDMVGERMGPNNIVMCWAPDGNSLIFRTKQWNFSGLRGQLMSVSKDGGDGTPLPLTEGGFCSYSPDGSKMALNRMFREFRTWKYYRGGQADDIWINTIGTNEIKNITNNPAQDIYPMWVDGAIFFLSDRDHIMNLFRYDTANGQISKVTNFDFYDCKFPSYSKDWIVFENGGWIYKVNTHTLACSKVDINIAADNRYSRDKFVNQNFSATGMSPDGKRLVGEVRGDIFTVPSEQGATYNLTRTPGAHDRGASWSPDGKTIAFFSDLSGEYQLYTVPADNLNATPKAHTSFETGYPQGIIWSNDSKNIYFSTEKNELWQLTLSSGALKMIYKPETGRGGGNFKLSPDGKWMVFSGTTGEYSNVSQIQLLNLSSGEATPISTEWYSSSSPIFSNDGKYVFYTSGRDYHLQRTALESNAAYTVGNYIFIASLSKDTPNPLAIRSDEYVPAETAAPAPAAPSKKAAQSSKPAPSENDGMKIDFNCIIDRTEALPLPSGNFQLIACVDDELYYSKGGELRKYSLKTLEDSSVSNVSVRMVNSDFSKALVNSKGNTYVVSTKGFKPGSTAVPTSDASVVIDYAQEWKQIFDESWRITRDFFYLENMHGKDWQGIHDKYAQLVPYVRHRHDLTYLIGEMLSELNVGHAYITSGEVPDVDRIPTGLLGGKYTRDEATGSYLITKLFRSESWGEETRSPLRDAGVQTGEWITAINGVPYSQYKAFLEPLVGKVGKVTALTIASTANGKNARTVYVKPVASETSLAYYDWVQRNIDIVDSLSNGQIGYIHIPDMGTPGMDAFTKMYYNQTKKPALIIDDRMNGGGNVSPIILERLLRTPYRLGVNRNFNISTVPGATHYGPKVCLVDKYSSSDGDLFPWGFQETKLGPIIGTRTWGGIVGIGGSKPFLDGQDMRTPGSTSLSPRGEWIIEGHGVDPDIVIDINPYDDYVGEDAQLEKAIDVLLEALKTYPKLPKAPAPRTMP